MEQTVVSLLNSVNKISDEGVPIKVEVSATTFIYIGLTAFFIIVFWVIAKKI